MEYEIIESKLNEEQKQLSQKGYRLILLNGKWVWCNKKTEKFI